MYRNLAISIANDIAESLGIRSTYSTGRIPKCIREIFKVDLVL